MRDAPTAATAPTRTARVRVPAGPRALAVCAVLVAAEVVAAIVVLVSHESGHSTAAPPVHASSANVGSPSSPRSSTAVTATASAARSWAVATLPGRAHVVADADLATTLSTHFGQVWTPAALAADPPSDPSADVDYVIATPSLVSSAASSTALSTLLSSSVPIAVFGSAGSATTVRQLSPASSATVSATRANAAAMRRRIERQLLANPAVTVSGSARRVLGDGGLDLRAATVLALMADRAPVQITAVVPVAGEAAAHMAARTVEVRTAAAALSVLDSLPSGYRLDSDTVGSDGLHRLSWPFAADFTTAGP